MSDKEDYESREATRTYYDHQNTHKSKGHTDRTSRSRRYTPQYETKPERHSPRKEYRRIEDIPRRIGDKSDSDTEEDTPRENTKTEYFRRKYRRSRDSPDLHTGRREITREEQEILNEERRNRRSSDQHDNRRPKELTNIDAGRKTPRAYDFDSRRNRPKEFEDYDESRRRPKDQDEYGRQWEPRVSTDDFDDRERRDKLEGLENIYAGRRSQRVFQATDPKRGGPTIWNERRSPGYEQQDNFSRTFDLKHLEDFDPKMEDQRRRKSKEPKEEEFDTGRTRTHEEVDRKSHLLRGSPKELKDAGRRRSPDYVNPQNFERRNPSTNQDHIKRTPDSSPQKLEYLDGRRTEQEEVFTSRGRPKSAKTREQTSILQAEETDPRRKVKDTERLRQLEDYNENKRSQDDFHRTSSSIRERAKELDLEKSDQNKTDPRRRLNEQLKHFFAGKRTPREEDHRETISTRGKPKDSVEEKRREYQDDLHRRPKSTERTLLDDVDTEIASIIERRKEFVGGRSLRVNEPQEELHRNTDSRPGKQLENLEKRSPRISVVEDDFGTLAISIRGSPKDLEEFIEGRRSPQPKENRSRDSRRSPRPSDAFDRETIYLREKRTKDYAGEKPTPRAIEPEEDLQRKTNRRTKFEQFQDFIVGKRSQRIDPEYDYDKETISIIERPKVFEEFLERRNPRPNDSQDVQKSDPRRERPKQMEDYDTRRKDFYKEIRSPKDLEEFIERRKSPEPQDEFRRKDPSSRRRSSRQEDEFNKRTGSRERKSKELEKLKIKEDLDDSRRTKSREKDETEERRRTPGQLERVSRKSDSGRERQRKDSFEEEQTRQGTDLNRKDVSRRRRKSREDEEPEDFNEGRRNQIEQPEYFEEKNDSRRRKSRENKEMEDFNKRRTSPEGFDQKVYSQKAMLRIGKDLDEFNRETR